MKRIGFDGYNIGGLSLIYEIPESCIKSLEHDYLTGKNMLHLKRIENVLEIYFTPETGGFEEEKTKSNQGDKYAIKITGTIPKDDEANSMLIAYLNHGYHHYLFQDNNGQIRFKKNLSFKQMINTGTEISTINSIKFEISGIYSTPSFYLSDKVLSFFK